jgi:hypothetical protein
MLDSVNYSMCVTVCDHYVGKIIRSRTINIYARIKKSVGSFILFSYLNNNHSEQVRKYIQSIIILVHSLCYYA